LLVCEELDMGPVSGRSCAAETKRCKQTEQQQDTRENMVLCLSCATRVGAHFIPLF